MIKRQSPRGRDFCQGPFLACFRSRRPCSALPARRRGSQASGQILRYYALRAPVQSSAFLPESRSFLEPFSAALRVRRLPGPPRQIPLAPCSVRPPASPPLNKSAQRARLLRSILSALLPPTGPWSNL